MALGYRRDPKEVAFSRMAFAATAVATAAVTAAAAATAASEVTLGCLAGN